ncbi:hypothetical protein [Actinomadura sp. HBU206391]|uniref:hypothetical protein n=1 Tax=Actinomadura sp. HBU206391 TaxID=2731692 RepID=UPI00164F00F8|nr:hypothetical protein [Actinomadura sp. HBU206391]MBC6459408.1 hypothetical protein [Actinomadura sp. HBU206391]
MFWRKTREAIGRFHPLHQSLIWERTLSAALPPAEWAMLLASMSQHDALVKRRKWRLPDRMGTTLVPLIRVLCEDVAPNGALALTADLRGPDVPGKAGPTRDLPVHRPIRSVKEWFVHDTWLRLRADLRDGSVLELTVTDRIRHRRIHKVNPRGKHKRKTKTKVVQRISATRVLPKGRAIQRPAVPPPGWIRLRVRDDKRAVLRATAKVGPNAMAPAEQVLMVAAELFRWTPPRRTAA